MATRFIRLWAAISYMYICIGSAVIKHSMDDILYIIDCTPFTKVDVSLGDSSLWSSFVSCLHQQHRCSDLEW